MFDGNDGDYREEIITNNGFWPDVDLQDFQRSRAIPTDISADFLADALIATLTEINGELSEVQKNTRQTDLQRHRMCRVFPAKAGTRCVRST